MNVKSVKHIFSLLCLAYLTVACTPVAVWEHGNLAKAQMSMDPHPLHSVMRTHKYSSREAAAGGHTAGGGGCGCY